MRKTPDAVSRARQRLGAEMAVWRAGIAAAQLDLAAGVNPRAENLSKITFGEAQLTRCKKEMSNLSRLGRRRFWPPMK